MSPAALAAALVLLASSACVKGVPDEVYASDTVRLGCCGRADEPVEITFLGVGGWILRKGDAAVLTAPFFSNPGLFEAGTRTIEARPDRIDRHLPNVSDVTAILVGHGHYDHLMDVPYVAREKAPMATVYLNRTSKHQIAPFGLPAERLRVIEPDELGNVGREGLWIDAGPGVRLMPLLSHHGPHFAGETFYAGVRTRDMESAPTAATEWLDGETMAFLVDLLNDDGSVALRVYFQDAVAEPPWGLVPPLADGVPVDVALIVPATYAEVHWHPEAILDNAEPRQVLLGHWEAFFTPPDEPAEPVPFTDLPDFLKRLERALPEGAEWHLPRPGTRFLFDG